MKEYKYTVEEDQIGERVDKSISLSLADLSRSYIQKLISNENVLINGKPCKASSRINQDDVITVITPDSIIPDINPEDIALDILYEDSDVIIINKPKDMVVHPAPGHYSGTLVNALLYHCKNDLSGINGVLRPGIVHRIDRDTTGSLIVCKNDKAHEKLSIQFKNHTINREYRAIVTGSLPDSEGTINKPIGRSKNDRKKMAINAPNGKNAITHYKVLKRFKNYTYISCKLETGRTHQIRVHMASIGHPLLGDEIYGNVKSPFNLKGQCLHAYILGFIHPTTEEYVETTAQLPDYFIHLLDILE